MGLAYNASVESPPITLYIKSLGVGFAIPGALFVPCNILIALAVFRPGSSVLKNPCAIFIGILGIVDAVTSLHFFQTGVTMILEWIWIPQMHCFLTQTPYIFSHHVSSFFIFVITLDRFICLGFTVAYTNLNRGLYIGGWVCLSLLFGLSMEVFSAVTASWDMIVPACSLHDTQNGLANVYWNRSNLAIVGVVIIIHVASIVRIKTAENLFENEEMAEREKRLLHSTLIIAGVYCSTWLIVLLVHFAVTSLNPSPTVLFHVMTAMGPLASVNFGANFFIYYARSDVYRQEFRKMLGRQNNEVEPVTTISHPKT